MRVDVRLGYAWVLGAALACGGTIAGDTRESGDTSAADPDPWGACGDPGDAAPVDALTYVGRGEWGWSGGFLEILDVQTDGALVYTCTGTQGIQIFDASADGPPALVWEGGTPYSNNQFPRCQHLAFDASRQRIVVTSRGDEIQPTPFFFVKDVTDPAAPQNLKGFRDATYSIEGAVFHGERIVAATHATGVAVFEDRGGTDWEVVGGYRDTGSDAWQPVLLDSTTLLVAEGVTGLRAYDLTDVDPRLVSTLALGGSSKDLVVRDGVAYVAASSKIVAVDVSEPASMRVLGELPTRGTALAIDAGVGDTVVTAEWDEVRVYDVSDPSTPRLTQSERVPTGGAFSRVLSVATGDGPNGARAYAGEWQGLHAYDQVECGIGPDVWVTPPTIQFPTVPVGESLTRVMVVHNDGNQTLDVTNVEPLSSEVSVDPPALSIAPGEAAAVEIRYAPSTTQQTSTDVIVWSNDPDEPARPVSISGNLSGLDVGDPAPDFTLFDLEGNPWSLADLEGQVAVLAYFATF